MQKYFFIALLTALTDGSFAQEIVTGLQVNRSIEEVWNKSPHRKGVTAADTLDLPFADDFSRVIISPDNGKWSDSYVFINNTFSVKQPSSGIATFDALDQTGKLYETAGQSVAEGDKLTSQAINLSYPSSDDIYLSFFYEPGGLGDLPEASDSLTLSFWAPGEAKWYSVWRAPQLPKNRFTPVIIRIDNNRFLKKGFRFRFTGYVSLGAAISDPSMAGSSDNWNLDYIKLARFRSEADTTLQDVAFTLPVRSSLKNFEAMPWKHFRQFFLSEMGPFINITYRNNDAILRNVTRSFEIKNLYTGATVHSFSAGATNIDPLSTVNYNAGLLYTYNSTGTDSALFSVKSILTTDAFDNKNNDTLVYYQRFGRDFAYDDGTAEGGYGINGLGSRSAMVAYRYRSLIADTLRAVMICFNDSYQNSNQRSFDLMVWDDTDGVPSSVIYQGEEQLAKPGATANGFTTYILTDPKAVFGDFFVGWRQRSETFLNAGFDVNTPHKGKQMYYLNGNWNVSQAQGSVMIRPIFGPPINTVGTEDVILRGEEILLWPNPVSETLMIRRSDLIPGNETVIVTDMSGRERIRKTYENEIDVSSLYPGMYILRIVNGKSTVSTKRFIIAR